MNAWLGIVSREHVRRGVALGIAQIGHGKRAGLARMAPGDWLVYYSPRNALGEPATLRTFTAIGQIADKELWQADEGDFKPWRLGVTYVADAVEVPLLELQSRLDLCAEPNWGYQLRRGLVPLSGHDLEQVRAAMTRTAMAPTR
jgi:EVE domain